MNYYSENDKELKQSVASLLKTSPTSFRRVTFSVSYSQNRKMSNVIVEVYPSPKIQGIILYYTRGLQLFDTIVYRSRSFVRVNRDKKSVQHLNRIVQFLSERIPQFSPITPRKIEEESDEIEKLDKKDQQIQSLKDRNRVEKEINRSLRNQMKVLRTRK